MQSLEGREGGEGGRGVREGGGKGEGGKGGGEGREGGREDVRHESGRTPLGIRVDSRSANWPLGRAVA